MSFLLEAVCQTTNQSSNELDTSLLIFEERLTYLNSIKPHMLSVTGDLSVRLSSWWIDDIDIMRDAT